MTTTPQRQLPISILKLNYTVRLSQEGREAEYILKNEMRLSVSLIRKLKSASAFFVNGRSVFTNYQVCAGDEIQLVINEASADYPPEEDAGKILDILYEDEYLLGLNKPLGYACSPLPQSPDGTLANYALDYILKNGGDGLPCCQSTGQGHGRCSALYKSAYVKSLMPGLITVRNTWPPSAECRNLPQVLLSFR
jgi:hypothetical protein